MLNVIMLSIMGQKGETNPRGDVNASTFKSDLKNLFILQTFFIYD
jgi:hypothetical protein